MKIGIASDHRGYDLKEKLLKKIKDIEIIDYGCYTGNSCDYSVNGIELATHIVNKDVAFGIAICGTGIGMSIACNKVKGIRCARAITVEDVKLSRLHNNANVLALPGNLKTDLVIELIDTFVHTNFSNEDRHYRRLKIIQEYENKQICGE